MELLTVSSVLESLKEARKKYSWKDIKEKLKGHAVVKEVNEKENTVSIELP